MDDLRRDFGKTAVILFNLGGPDKLDSVKPYLYNFFKDPAIIDAPFFIRYPLAFYISWTRSNMSRENYRKIGGKTTLIEETENQRKKLEELLKKKIKNINVHVVMRYWHPRVKNVIENLDTDYENILLLPLYPQYSTTTTGSSFKEWKKHYKGKAKIKAVCCYPEEKNFIKSHQKRILETWEKRGKKTDLKLLFSAHGLPLKIIEKGDPYQDQIEKTAKCIIKGLPKELQDFQVCYQSKLGPLKWLEPSLDQALKQAKEEEKGVIISPIAFVSEHVETLVELDEEYAEIAEELELKFYIRIPALSIQKDYITSLSELVLKMLNSEKTYPEIARKRICCEQLKECPNLGYYVE